MKFTTLIPTRYNDGKRVPKRLLRAILDRLVRRFGGCTNEGVAKGQWIDPAEGVLYQDESERVSVVCDRIMLDEREPRSSKLASSWGSGRCTSRFATTTACRSWRFRTRTSEYRHDQEQGPASA